MCIDTIFFYGVCSYDVILNGYNKLKKLNNKWIAPACRIHFIVTDYVKI